MKPITIVFLTFLTLAFVSGIYFCATHTVLTIENMEVGNKGSSSTNVECPDMLIRSGNAILLYNSQIPESPGINPISFHSLDEYINYLEEQRKRGLHCPVLFLQEEINTQGQSVYRIRPDIFSPQYGLPNGNQVYNTITPKVSIPTMPLIDANMDNPPWNSNTYNGFDPTGQDIGRYTALDAIHDSTFKGQSLSDNPMDDNWGGVLYTKAAVDLGKYADNQIVPPSASGMFAEKSDNIHDQKLSTQNSIFA
jgi:hypothetical protein